MKNLCESCLKRAFEIYTRLGDSSWRSAKPEPEGQAVAREGFGDGYTDFGALSSPSCAHSTSLRAGFEAATQD